MQHVRDRWNNRLAETNGYENSWHWPRDTKRKEDTHHYHEANGVQIMSTLRSLAMKALRLDGFWSITEGSAALVNDIKSLLEHLGWREAVQPQASG